MNRHIPSVQSTVQAADLASLSCQENAVARGRSNARRHGVNILIAAVLIGFGALHFVGGAMIRAVSNATATSHHMLAAD